MMIDAFQKLVLHELPAKAAVKWVGYALFGVFLTMLAGPGQAQKVHRWVDEEGNVHFSQTPPEDQQRNQSELVTYGSADRAQTDPACCLELRILAENVGKLLLQGYATTDIYKSISPSEYPEVIEVVNFVSGRTYGGFSVSEVGSLAQSTCMNGKFQACRLGQGVGATDDGPRSASGTLVAEGVVLTNAHAVHACRSVSVGEPSIRASVVNIDRDLDLALLKVPGVVGQPVAVSSSAQVTLGESVTVAGYPLSNMLSSLNITNGTVSSESGVGQAGLFQISAPVQPGSSGGPVLNESGHLLGIVVSRLNDQVAYARSGAIPQNVNFAISPTAVRSFLDSAGVAYSKGLAREALENTRRAAAARNFTFQVRCQ